MFLRNIEPTICKITACYFFCEVVLIEEIDVGEKKKATARIAICQISLPKEQICFAGKRLSPQSIAGLGKRVKRTLAEIAPEQPDVIQFPECSIPEELIEDLKEFSDQTGAIIIGGSHYIREASGFISRCPIIIPGHPIYHTEKLTPSPLEQKPVRGMSVIPGSRRLVFKNSTIGTFIPYICADFLDLDAMSEIQQFDPEVVFVSSFHPSSSKHYYPELSQACGVGRLGAYCLYSNVKSSSGSDGGSALFAITDKVYHSTFQETGVSDLNPPEKVWQAKSDNDFLVADVNLENRKPEIPKRVLTNPNVSLLTSRSKLRRKKPTYDHSGDYKLVVFDMDGTLLRGLTFSWVTLWELCGDTTGERWRSLLNRYRNGKLEYDEWCNMAVQFFRSQKLTLDLIKAVAREEAYLCEGFEEGMSRLKSMGYKTALVSGGVDIFLKTLIPQYRDLFEDVYVNQLHFDGDGVVSGVDPTPFDYEGKARAIETICSEHGFDIEETIFVGDNFNDEQALRRAGYGIIFGDTEDGVQHVANKVIRSENFHDLVDHIKAITNLSGA